MCFNFDMENFDKESIYNLLNKSLAVTECRLAHLANYKKYPTLERWDYNWIYEPQSPFYNVWITVNGGGKLVTTKGEYDLEEGGVYLVPRSDMIMSSVPDKMDQYFFTFIEKKAIIPFNQIYKFKRVSYNVNYITENMNVIRDNYQKNDVVSSLKTSAAAAAIISEFIEGVKNVQTYTEMLPVLNFVNERLSENISVEQLSQITHYSPEYFSSIFKQRFGVSPKKFILNQKINEAKIQLATTQKTIRQIGEEVGFPDQIYFSKIFKKTTGFSPSDYVKTMRTI